MNNSIQFHCSGFCNRFIESFEYYLIFPILNLSVSGYTRIEQTANISVHSYSRVENVISYPQYNLQKKWERLLMEFCQDVPVEGNDHAERIRTE